MDNEFWLVMSVSCGEAGDRFRRRDAASELLLIAMQV